ncbi:MAG: PPC domain-containing protein [Planctomycetaceae bacterium]
MPQKNSRRACLVFALPFLLLNSALAQKAPDPEIGYIFPPGGKAGTTVDVRLGAVDWTPDTQILVLDPRVRIEPQGSLGPLLLPEPPYFVGTKAYNPPPLPRELAAKVVIPADMPQGPVRWQVANANGTSQTGIFVVGDGAEVIESDEQSKPQRLDAIPITVSGRLCRNEEVDRYRFRALADGPVTCTLAARRLGSPMNGVLEVRDAGNHLVAEAVDTRGHDIRLTFAGRAQQEYTLSLRELDFRGHQSFVYRLNVSPSPQVVAAIPAAGRRGETRSIEFVGIGIATGATQLESVTREVAFPDDKPATKLDYRLETPHGVAAPFPLLLSDLPEQVEAPRSDASPALLELPAAVTGFLDRRYGTDRYRFAAKKNDVWQIDVESAVVGSPLDVTATVYGPDGKQLATNDDAPGTTDAALSFTAPDDGLYDVAVGDVSGASGSRAAIYRLAIRRPIADFHLEVPQRISVLIGEKAELAIKAVREGGFNEPIAISMAGLPTGIAATGDLMIPAGSGELKVVLQSAADSPATASLVNVTGTARTGDQDLRRVARAQAAGNLAPQSANDNAVEQVLIASTMKPRTRIWPVESDERTVHRGSTHPAEIGVERLEGFDGDVLIQMESKQGPKFRQGLTGPDVVLPRGRNRLFYPCFVPEMAETLDAYRMSMVAVTRVPDPRGNVRYLLSKMSGDTSVGITVEGGLLKIAGPGERLQAKADKPLDVPISISRSPRLTGPVHLELKVPEALMGTVDAPAIDVPAGQTEATLRLDTTHTTELRGSQKLVVRAVVLEPGNLPNLEETAGCTPMNREMLDFLKAGYLPVLAETTITIEF